MDALEKTISNLVESQFPAYYRENGPTLVMFVKEYYRWMEQESNPLYLSRRILDLKDIDATTDDFLVYFKEKYLKNIQFETDTNVRQLIKHCLDLYRAKGTERAIDLLFRLVFGVGAEVRYPGQNVFRLSDGRWKRPQYLEMELNERNREFSGLQVRGIESGAVAFVESVVRRTVEGKLIDVLYVSISSGIFKTGEFIVVDNDSTNPLNDLRIRIVGSLSGLILPASGSGTGYSVGDVVQVESVSGGRGRQALARVTAVSDINGIVSFTLVEGGWGYTSETEVLVSEKVLRLSNVSTAQTTSYFTKFETGFQRLYANSAGTVSVSPGAFSVNGTATAFLTDFSNGQHVLVYNNTGDYEVLKINIVTSDTVMNTVARFTFTNTAASFARVVAGTIIGENEEVDLSFNSPYSSMLKGETVRVTDVYGRVTASGVVETYEKAGTTGSVYLTTCTGAFKPGDLAVGVDTGATVNVTSVSTSVGLTDLGGSFVANSLLIGVDSRANGMVATIGAGSGATVNVSSDMLYAINVAISSDFLRDHRYLNINAVAYGFPGMPSGNLTNDTLDAQLTRGTYQVGKTKTIVDINPGVEYTIAPIVAVRDPITLPFNLRDSIITITGPSGNFRTGELVQQTLLGGTAYGLVKPNSNSSVLFVERMSLFDNAHFTVTSNSTTKIVGYDSGATANVFEVSSDDSSDFIGLNAIIEADVSSGNGAVTSMAMIDSGFGFVNDEIVSFGSGNTSGTAYAEVMTHGTGRGFYQKKGGFLSDEKLFDGLYYQDYSYEVLSSVTLDKYADMLRNVLHVAGTKPFGAFVHRGSGGVPLGASAILVSTSPEDEVIVTSAGSALARDTGQPLVVER